MRQTQRLATWRPTVSVSLSSVATEKVVAMEVMAARQISTPVPEDTSVPSVQKNVTFGENHVLADSASAESIATSLNTSGLTLSAVSPCCSASGGQGRDGARASVPASSSSSAPWPPHLFAPSRPLHS